MVHRQDRTELMRRTLRAAFVRCSSSSAVSDTRKPLALQAGGTSVYRNLLPKKKVSKRSRGAASHDVARRVSAHVMANAHDQADLANALRARFGAGSVQAFGDESSGSGALVPLEVGSIEGVVHLHAPASGMDAQHGSPPASVFFFTGSTDGDDLSRSTSVSVWWGAEPSFEEALQRDLQAMSKSTLSRQQQQDRLSVSRAVMKWQPGLQSELTSDEIIIDATCDQRSRMLDQLSFSHALQRHMKLLLLEEEMDRILSSVKRIVRQDRSIVIRRFLPLSLGGLESGARTMQRLLLMREFNFDDSIMSTPDWLWEQPAREALYDAMVAEFEILDRTEAINQQLDYAQATIKSLKEDAQHQHSTFLEYAIVLLIAFEVFVEMHAIGWLDWPEAFARSRSAGSCSSPRDVDGAHVSHDTKERRAP